MITLNNTYTLGRTPWARVRPVAQASTCTKQHSQQTFIHAAGRIQTRNPGKQVALGSANNGFGS